MLRDESRGRVIPESTPIIEYLARHDPGRTALVPDDPDLAWEVRRLAKAEPYFRLFPEAKSDQ